MTEETIVQTQETNKKEKKQTHHIMRIALKYSKTKMQADTFPSDQFIMTNLPSCIREIDGAAKPVKRLVGAVAVTVTAIICGIIAPAAMLAFGSIALSTTLLTGVAALAIGSVAGFFGVKDAKVLKDKYMKPVTKRLMAKHIVAKTQKLKKSFKENRFFRRKEEKAAEEENRPVNKNENAVEQGKASSWFSGALKLKEAWDNSVTDENKQKVQDGLDDAKKSAGEKLDSAKKSAGDTLDSAKKNAEEALGSAKNKMGSMFSKFKNRNKKKGSDPKP